MQNTPTEHQGATMYRVGWPGWKSLARWGVPVRLRIDVHFDEESKSYWADSPDLDGLTVAGEDLNALHQEVKHAVADLLTLALHAPQAKAHTEIRLRETAVLAA
jgi:hypothetical protein